MPRCGRGIRGEPLDLVDDGGGGVAGVAERHVRVGPDGVDVADRAGRVGEVLLPDEHEWSLHHRALGALTFGVCDFREGPAQVDGARAPAIGVGPPNVALDGEVDLEGRRSGAVAPIGPVDAGGHHIAVDPEHRGRAEVEHHDVGVGDVAAAGDGHPGGDGAAVRVRAAASAFVIDPDPPRATGQPWRWPLARIINPSDAVSGRSNLV